jgi:hypothetical protein
MADTVSEEDAERGPTEDGYRKCKRELEGAEPEEEDGSGR